MVAGETKLKELSEFISSVLNDNGLKNEMVNRLYLITRFQLSCY
jgi:hypothetical protein